jgi:HD-GYP domain-containing protein (c-di-GMP phosphodiesterase class II)
VKENKPAQIASVMLVGFLVLSIWLIMQYVAAEKERDMQNWQERLAVLAESQKRSVESWLDVQIDSLKDVANNPLLQIFLTMGELEQTDVSVAQRGQAGHLRNLIVAAANRMGVFKQAPPISSNQKNIFHEGMGIINRENKLLLSTRYFPDRDTDVVFAASKAMNTGKVVVHGIHGNSNRDPSLTIVVPVKIIQAGKDGDTFAGAVVAVINPENSLYKILAQHWLTTRTDETLLVKTSDASTVYMSPPIDNHPLFHQVASSNEKIAANFARQNIGGFAIKNDYRGIEVLVTSRKISNTDWVMVQKIDASEALSESRSHQDFVLTVFMLVVFVIAVSFIAIWRHSSSVRLKKATERLEARTELLIAVSDNIRDPIFLLDHNNNFVFVNNALSSCLKLTGEIRGMPMNHVFNKETTDMLLELLSSESDVKNHVMELSIADCSTTAHVTVVGLKHGKYKESALYVLHDITSLKEAQDRHNRLLEGIISTLVHATDMHDPHCANHSERTREVAVAIAQAMELSEERINALAMAAQLANIGKLYLPSDMLTKMEPLTDEEEVILRNNVNDTIEILKDLEFDGPVIKFIEQKNEYLDGSGYPAAISSDDILQESRVLSVANAFVAMSSARAYRKGIPVHEVLNKLLEQADSRYDRHVVAALFHVAENRSDWSSWQDVQA